MRRARALQTCPEYVLLLLALTSDGLLTALGLKYKSLCARQAHHNHTHSIKIASPDARTVLGEPVMDHVLLSIEVQRIVSIAVLALMVFVGQNKPPMDAIVFHRVSKELLTVAVCPRSEGVRRSASRRPALVSIKIHEEIP